MATVLRKAMQDFARLHRLSSADKAVFMTEHMEGFFQDLAAMCQERTDWQFERSRLQAEIRGLMLAPSRPMLAA